VLQKPGDAGPPVDANVSGCRPALETSGLARPNEEAQDVTRVVGERVREVFVAACPVDEHATVRPDASAEEGERFCLDEAHLPVLEHDWPLVLLAGAVLRQKATEMLVIHPEHDHPALVRVHPTSPVAGETASQQCLRLVHDFGVASVEEDPQPLRAGVGDDVPVAEVEP